MTEVEYKNKIRRLDHRGLLRLWSNIKRGKAAAWASGKAFEYLVVRAFELEGAKVRYPFGVYIEGTQIEQIDGAVYVPGISSLVESKDYRDPVNVVPIVKLRSQLLRRPSVTIGMVFSRQGFTDPALTLAQHLAPQSVLLWQGEEIDLALRKQRMKNGMLLKHRHSIETGMPDYNLLAGVLK